jgi:hypothetical protein
MQLRHTPVDLGGLPAPTGAHALAWSYLLDAACADAYHAGIAHLDLTLPAALADEIAARRPIAPPAPSDGPLATFGTGPAADPTAQRHYRLRFGLLAPRTLRAHTATQGAPTTGFALADTLYVYTLRTRLLGIPMRIFNLMARPQPADRALIALRYSFASNRPTPSTYLLETWHRTEGERG